MLALQLFNTGILLIFSTKGSVLTKNGDSKGVQKHSQYYYIGI